MGHVVNGMRHDRTALVLYGSETGNAQDVAQELGRMAERLHFGTQVLDMNSADFGSLSRNTVVLFALSTTGQGELPANARKFWRGLLKKRLPVTFLRGVKFTLFGLGDSSYPKFNWAARKLHKRLLQLGAVEIYPTGEADEQHPDGLDGVFLPWSLGLKDRLLGQYPLPENVKPIPDDALLQPKWILGYDQPNADLLSHEEITADVPQRLADEELGLLSKTALDEKLPISGSVTVKLVQNTRVTPSAHWQDVRHLIFATSSPVDYSAGDVLIIFPKNFSDDVDQLLEAMDWVCVADKPIKFIPMDATADRRTYPPPPVPHLLPYPMLTLRGLLTNYLDITSIPRRSFFSLIAHFTTDVVHKERLLEFAKPEYIDEFYDYTTRPRRSILEVLQEFQSVRIPWHWVASAIPLLRGRQYSIASGGALKHRVLGNEVPTGSSIELLVAIVKYRTVIKKIRQGVCTRYLASLPEGAELAVVVQKGSLDMKESEVEKPVVMIGAGTGVAPMRALLWERLGMERKFLFEQETELDVVETTNRKNGAQDNTMNNALFFGCRNYDADYFFREEWDKLKKIGCLEVFAAFSRDQRQKVYVQDLVRRESALVYRMLYELSGVVYICGSSGKMPQAVREALIEVFQREGPMQRQAAESHLLSMEKVGRYKQETW